MNNSIMLLVVIAFLIVWLAIQFSRIKKELNRKVDIIPGKMFLTIDAGASFEIAELKGHALVGPHGDLVQPESPMIIICHPPSKPKENILDKQLSR